MITDARYQITTTCLKLLEMSGLPHLNKLHLEVLLLETKIMLLKTEPTRRMRKTSYDNSPFVTILVQVEELCRTNCIGPGYRQVIDLLNELVKELSDSEQMSREVAQRSA